MQAIGIRELRQGASRYLRAVQEGETFEVTDRGRPIAMLVPLPDGSRIDRLIASGRLTPAVGDALALGAPLTPASGAQMPSRVLERLRAEER
ncbi:MAG TPA: type II toxin-antitoxin system prevent-host-death family antitoxin [Solirubrobacteraceae bacterium]|jgi:prevent-host-death family protein|nr:type II toxin-antitoxin system prevent-host-death family antitoxin [Solirubrobacteraceae bacterium]